MLTKNDRLGKKLKDRGLKATPQRLILLNIIEECGHVDIEFLYKRLKETIPTISISTVYNNVKKLQDAGIIKEVSISAFKPLYETNISEHIHLVCIKCRKIIDFYVDKEEIKKFFSSITKKEILSFEITLFYLCEECKD